MPPCSLMDLPTELLVEIVSHYTNSYTFLSPFVRQEHNAQREARQQALRSLSQTSSVLRELFLPILWEQFEASKPNFQESHTQSEFAKTVAPYIKSVHITMKLWSNPAEMEAIFLFLQFLRGLPNLSGLQIQRVPWSIVPILTYAFNSVTLPTVTAVSVPNSLDVIFPSFPNVTTLASPELLSGNRLIPAATEKFPRIDAISGLRLGHAKRPHSPSFKWKFVDALSLAFPHLRALSVTSTLPDKASETPEALFAPLHGFPTLSELSLVYENGTLPLEALIEGGKEVLHASRSRETKILRVWSNEVHTGPQVIHVERC
ncbi:hypothetical protein C8F04DRAFT_143484 [Mycena alexandri]|uniref:F-box domain-containing protein n=1 Tax=Mycena alexandri TaxID=1745969 RepID=A0AAD6X740_9AGAR|nr:hypothetical protein C8F04DRAFT_143484 [Mycena alexandri]